MSPGAGIASSDHAWRRSEPFEAEGARSFQAPTRRSCRVRMVRVERHWWNGQTDQRRRRDVYIRTDGQRWQVMARMGGDSGRATVDDCPGLASAEILAKAWMGGGQGWQEVPA
jgi:hypothetical protein